MTVLCELKEMLQFETNTFEPLFDEGCTSIFIQKCLFFTRFFFFARALETSKLSFWVLVDYELTYIHRCICMMHKYLCKI